MTDGATHPSASDEAHPPEGVASAARLVVPPDPAAYDTERSAAARRRGLSTPYIPGGRDPDQASAEREDRRNVRILIAMVLVIIAAGFVLGFLASMLGFDALVGTP